MFNHQSIIQRGLVGMGDVYSRRSAQQSVFGGNGFVVLSGILENSAVDYTPDTIRPRTALINFVDKPLDT